jgi:proline iminopeptidase
MIQTMRKRVRFGCLAAVWAAALATGCSVPQVRDAQGRAVEGAVRELQPLEIGGVQQWISIRGWSDRNPILLVLHGGPGFSEMALVRHFNRALEEHFLVVNWDQPGAGKSNSADVEDDSLTVERYVRDAVEVIDYLRERFHQDKVYLLGHSWGSYLGLQVAHRFPERLHAYLGTGQVANSPEGELIGYRYALEQARRMGNEKAIKELESIGEPVGGLYAGGDFEKTIVERKWLHEFGGDYHQKILGKAYRVILLAPEYTVREKLKFFGEPRHSPETERAQFTVDFNGQIPAVQVPVYFLLGRHDYMAPSNVAEQYWNRLEAPVKRLYWFEESGHAPMFEEPDKFNRVVIEEILRGV